MIRTSFSLVALLLGFSAPASAHTVLLNAADLQQIQQNSVKMDKLTRNCAQVTRTLPRPVAVLNPLPHYTSQGSRSPNESAEKLVSDSQLAYRAGLCYLLTGQEEYAQATQRTLDAWASTLKQIPNAQGQADLNFNVPYMALAGSWVRGVGGWKGDKFADWLRHTVLPLSASANPNNHGAWGVLLEATSAAYLRDDVLMKRAEVRWRSLIRGAVNQRGILEREISRSGTNNWRGGADRGRNGLAYTHYFLMPAAVAAKIFADAGRPVWRTPEGELLGRAYKQAAVWTRSPEKFPFYASNGGQLNGTDNAAYFALLQTVYPDRNAEALLERGGLKLNGFRLLELFGPATP